MTDHTPNSLAAPLSLSQIAGALWKHRFKAFLAWGLVMALTIAAFLLLPKKYGSEGLLYIQLGRNNSLISPASGSSSISIQDTRETEIRSVVEIVRSRAVLEAVVDEVGADKILASSWTRWLPLPSLPKMESTDDSDGEGMTPEEIKAHLKKERATKALISSLDVNSQKKTSTVSIYVQANSPQLAKKLVDSIIRHTQQIHLKVHASSQSAHFFDDQFARQEKQLKEAIAKQTEFRNQKKILSLGAERNTVQGILSSLENNILNAEVEETRTREGLKKLRTLIASIEAQIAVPKTGVERLSYEDSRTAVFNLEAERERLVATYQANHPLVKQIDQQIRKVKKTLASMTSNRTESEMTSNPVYEKVKTDLVRAETEHARAVAKLESLREKRKIYDARLTELNNAELVADQLQRDVDIARQYLGTTTQKRGEAVAMSSLDAQNISGIVSAQEGTLQLKHVSPRGSLLIPLGFILGTLAAFGTALFYERDHLAPNLTEGDIEQAVELPVLVTLPRVYSNRNMVN